MCSPNVLSGSCGGGGEETSGKVDPEMFVFSLKACDEDCEGDEEAEADVEKCLPPEGDDDKDADAGGGDGSGGG